MSFSLIEAVEKSGGVVGPYGERFGRLVVLRLDHIKVTNNTGKSRVYNSTRREYYDLCLCDCGKTKVINRMCLVHGFTLSCGCYHVEKTKQSNTKHNMTGHALYKLRNSIISKCYNKNNKHYNLFGGKGITVCDRWLESPVYFIDDIESTIGQIPASRSTIIRIDENGNFETGNVRWISMGERTAMRHAANRLAKELAMDELSDTAIAYDPKYVKGPYGKRFGRLFVLYHDRNKKYTKKSTANYDICQCECGVIVSVNRQGYCSGHTKSCGCFRKEWNAAINDRKNAAIKRKALLRNSELVGSIYLLA